MRPLLFTTILLLGAGCQDRRDQRSLRRLCALPSDAEVVSWKGAPSSPFAPREGLELAGAFRIPPGFVPSAASYRPAPWPAGREYVEHHFQLGAMFDDAAAVRCETAGNDLLNADSTVPCDSVARPLDVVLCVVDAKSGLIRARARTFY
jgi:hypothetical protein